MNEILEKRINGIDKKFMELGIDFLKEDITELFEIREDIRERVENIKFKNITFFRDEELNSIGFTLEDVQVEFFITIGEDEDGAWYEATAEIVFF